MIADGYIDEVFYDGEDIRSKLSNPNGGCSWKEVKLDYVPGVVLAVAAHDNQPGWSAGFSLEAKSETVEDWNFKVNVGDGSNVKVFGIDDPDDHHGPMKRPDRKQPPDGWTDNSFDDSSWGIPDSNKVQYSCWYERKKYTFWRVAPGGASGGPAMASLVLSKKPAAINL
eukprot:6273628-Prymnesium_polylepis.1